MKKAVLFFCSGMLLSGAAFAQSSVTTNGKKFVLVEESTGAWCQYCPDGAVYLNNLLSSNPQVIGVSIHGGGGADNMKFADGNTVTSTYFTAFPLGMVDRAMYSGKVANSRSAWSAAATQQAAVIPDFDVTLKHGFNSTTGIIDIQVTAKTLKAVTGNYNMNVYVIEDSVKGTGSGWDQVNYYNTQSGHTYYGAGNPIVGFNHMHVVRAMLGGPFGTPGFITKDAAINKTFSKYYTYTLPSGANYKHFKLVAMVEKDNPTDPNDRAFNNSIEAKLTPGAATFKTTDVKTLSAISGMEVYPNPAASSIRLTGTFESTSSVQVSLINTIGQTVISRTLAGVNGTRCDEAIDVSSLSNGIYMLQVRSEEGQSTTQVVVQH